jgi:thymidylate synthase
MTKTDKIFKKNINKIYIEGTWDQGPRPSYLDGTSANSKFITQVFEKYDLSKGEYPITTLRPIAWKSGIKEVLWIYQDQSNSLEVLREKYGIKWWDEWESKYAPGTIGARYGHTVRKYSQIDNLLKELVDYPFSRRHIMTLWNIDDFAATDGLFPCAYETLWSVRYDEVWNCLRLDMTLVQRSSDYLTAGHINKIQYVALQMMVAAHCGYKVGKFCHLVQNLHIYDRHMSQASQLMLRKGANGNPILALKDYDKKFYDFTIDDFIMHNYLPQEPQMKFEIAI